VENDCNILSVNVKYTYFVDLIVLKVTILYLFMELCQQKRSQILFGLLQLEWNYSFLMMISAWFLVKLLVDWLKELVNSILNAAQGRKDESYMRIIKTQTGVDQLQETPVLF